LPLLGVAEGRFDLHQLRPRKYLAADVLVKLDVVARKDWSEVQWNGKPG
jgi:hypothetical protein